MLAVAVKQKFDIFGKRFYAISLAQRLEMEGSISFILLHPSEANLLTHAVV